MSDNHSADEIILTPFTHTLLHGDPNIDPALYKEDKLTKTASLQQLTPANRFYNWPEPNAPKSERFVDVVAHWQADLLSSDASLSPESQQSPSKYCVPKFDNFPNFDNGEIIIDDSEDYNIRNGFISPPRSQLSMSPTMSVTSSHYHADCSLEPRYFDNEILIDSDEIDELSSSTPSTVVYRKGFGPDPSFSPSSINFDPEVLARNIEPAPVSIVAVRSTVLPQPHVVIDPDLYAVSQIDGIPELLLDLLNSDIPRTADDQTPNGHISLGCPIDSRRAIVQWLNHIDYKWTGKRVQLPSQAHWMAAHLFSLFLSDFDCFDIDDMSAVLYQAAISCFILSIKATFQKYGSDHVLDVESLLAICPFPMSHYAHKTLEHTILSSPSISHKVDRPTPYEIIANVVYSLPTLCEIAIDFTDSWDQLNALIEYELERMTLDQNFVSFTAAQLAAVALYSAVKDTFNDTDDLTHGHNPHTTNEGRALSLEKFQSELECALDLNHDTFSQPLCWHAGLDEL